jgi:hypothetical protein
MGEDSRGEAVALAAAKLTLPGIVARTGVPRSTVARWISPAVTTEAAWASAAPEPGRTSAHSRDAVSSVDAPVERLLLFGRRV